METRKYINSKERRARCMNVIKRRGWTRYQVAKEIGVKQAQLEGYMRSENPNLGTLKKLAGALGVPLDYLISVDFKRKESE